MKKFLLYLSCFWVVNILAIASYSYPHTLHHCKITKATLNNYEPETFQPTNNLLRKMGQELIYCGTKILIKGRLLDQNCVPIADAKIYLWQVGSDGKYPYIPLRTRINRKMLNLLNRSSFTGSGTATSNNKGEFHFITIFPGATPHEKSNVNIRVEHHNLKQLQTKLYLPLKINPTTINVQNEMPIYYFDVVLTGTTLKRH